MKTFRKVFFWIHLIVGVLAATLILVMCVTGVLIAFESQITESAERSMRHVTPAGPPLGATALLAKFREAKPQANATAITLYADPTASAMIALGREGVVFVDPYSGAIRGEGSKGVRGFFRTNTELHRWLALQGESRETARSFTGACNAAFLFLALSGLYLWWPRKRTRRQFLSVMTFRRNLGGRARDFNWHNVIGLWSAPVLIVLTATAMVMSYHWASDLLYSATGSPKPPQQNEGPRQERGPGGAAELRGERSRPDGERPKGFRREGSRPRRARAAEGETAERRRPEGSSRVPENLDPLVERAKTQVAGWSAITTRFGGKPGVVMFSIVKDGSPNPSSRAQLSLDAKTGAVVDWQPYSKQSQGQKLRAWIRPLHTGTAFGFIGQLVAALASFGGAFLVWTGISLSLRRLAAWLRRKRGLVAATVPDYRAPDYRMTEPAEATEG